MITFKQHLSESLSRRPAIGGVFVDHSEAKYVFVHGDKVFNVIVNRYRSKERVIVDFGFFRFIEPHEVRAITHYKQIQPYVLSNSSLSFDVTRDNNAMQVMSGVLHGIAEGLKALDVKAGTEIVFSASSKKEQVYLTIAKKFGRYAKQVDSPPPGYKMLVLTVDASEISL